MGEAAVTPTNRDLAPWKKADLPDPPMPRGLSWIGVCGPGVIVLGVSIGSGEFLLGPATFVKHGLSLLWVTLVAVFFQKSLRKYEEDWEARKTNRVSIKCLAILTFLIWVAIIFLGRLIAYDHVWGSWSPSQRA